MKKLYFDSLLKNTRLKYLGSSFLKSNLKFGIQVFLTVHTTWEREHINVFIILNTKIQQKLKKVELRIPRNHW